MISLNDYLYAGDTVLRILHKYSADLKQSSRENHNGIDMVHANYLLQQIEMLEHNDFLSSQAKRIRGFYTYLAQEYPFMAFTFRGRIKSLIRSEEKFNGYIVDYIYNYYKEKGQFPPLVELKQKLSFFRDLLAYRIVVSIPIRHIPSYADRREVELNYLYTIANALPTYLEEHGFSVQVSEMQGTKVSPRLDESLIPYYRDYIENPTPIGYRSLHITMYDNLARCFVEFQLRTKEMDDYAEIGPANHTGYEKRQGHERNRRDAVPEGANTYFDEAYERLTMLQQIDFSKVDVNMFGAMDNTLINDGCGLLRGRLVMPYEHLSTMQNDLID